MSVKSNLLKNGIASLINKGIKIAEQLLLVPFFISAWGAAFYGEWLTLTIIPSIIGFSDLGFGTASSNSFILKYSSDEKQEAANISKSGFFSIHVIVVSTLLISLLLIQILNFTQVFENLIIPKNDAILALYLLMVSRVIGFYQPLNEAYFRAARKASYAMNLNGLNSGLSLIAGLLVLIFDGGVVVFAFSNMVVAIFFSVFYKMMADKILPINKEYEGNVLKSDIKDIFHKGFGFLLSPIWQAIFFQGTTFVVRIVLGPMAVAIFNTIRTLSRSANQINSIVISAILPELQFELGANNFKEARKLFRLGLLSISIIALTGILFLYFSGPWIFELWTRKAFNPPSIIWNILISGIVFNAIWWMSSDVLISVNRPYEFTVAGVVTAILAVMISYFLSLTWGLTGAAIGSLFLDVALFIYILPRSCIFIKQPLSSLFRDMIIDSRIFLRTINVKA